MSKIWILNNTRFGYKNNSKSWFVPMINYFKKIYIPTLKKHYKEGDLILHCGNIFNSDKISLNILIEVKKIFNTISEILPMYILSSDNDINEKNSIGYLFENNNIKIISEILKIDNITIIPNSIKNPLKFLNEINIINTKIDVEYLKNTLTFYAYGDDKFENENVIGLGSLYQFEDTNPIKGFYVIDTETGKKRFFENRHNKRYKTIVITDISDIEKIDKDDVDNNFVDVIIDRKLINDSQLKIDMLLNDFKFKSIKYVNVEKEIDTVISSTLNIEEMIREKIKSSGNEKVLSEFENILKIYKENY